jgi:ketosteroid isomerase-like protein
MIKLRTLSIGLGLLIAIFTLTSNAQTAATLPAPIHSALTEYDRAWNAKDVKAVERILDDDYTYFTSTGGITTRKATLEFLVAPDYKLTFVERSEITLLSKGDNVAIVSSRWKGRGNFGKEAINDDQRCGLVFARSGKTWKLLSEHCVQIGTR